MASMQRVVRKFHGFTESAESDRAYYQSLTPQQRLDILLDLLARYKDSRDETAERLERVYRVTKLSRS